MRCLNAIVYLYIVLKITFMAHSVYKYRTGEAYPHCYKYPQAGVTADCVVFSYDCKELKVLLVKRGRSLLKTAGHFLEAL